MKKFVYVFIFLLVNSACLQGQGFEKIYTGSRPSFIELNDSNLLCLSKNSVFYVNSTTGEQMWSKPMNGCFGLIIKGSVNNNYCLGLTSCSSSGGGPYPKNIIHNIDNSGDTNWTKTLGTTFNVPIGMYAFNCLYFANFTGQYSYILKIDSLGSVLDSIFLGNKNVRAITFNNQEIHTAFNLSQNDSAKIITLDSNLNIINTINFDSVPLLISKLEKTDTNFILLSGRDLFKIEEYTGVKQLLNHFDSAYLFDFTFLNDSVICLVGTHYYDNVIVILYDSRNNVIINSKSFGSYRYEEDGYHIYLIDGNDLIISGRTKYNDGNQKGYIFKISQDLISINCSDSLEILNYGNWCLGDSISLSNNSFGLNNLYTWELNGNTFNNYNVNTNFQFFADSVGTVEVKLISCFDTITTHIIVHDTIVPLFTFDSYGDSIVFYTPTGFGNQFSYWDFGDGYYSYDSIAHHIYLDTGNYIVTLNFYSNSCYSNQNNLVSITNSLGNKKIKQNPFEIYPNPSINGIFNISLNLQSSKIRVYNSLGIVVPFSQSSNQIRLINAISGSYYLLITTSSGKQMRQKLILKQQQ